ncbi:RNA polymerase sigma-70 factor (ECF subfamily) [Rhizobium sp. SG_E_25_P2]|uniref:RNA polymerase sigma factor n=1 Tax=Rhizobium sp. SG_E_25_P2 TaxID=2879942 RepID=UPI002474E9C2|nr:RNA polymerase sigma factor [Rhizobium sp. SG_E_25_P2]MDH6267310.1 RNA polymerase sigma-70 factor (ECF subfamily) [Rhizobium sp. SG_E_25_P2]
MDKELARRAGAGDREAFRTLIDRHYAFIHATAWKWTGNKADAEDAAQDVCIRLASVLSQFRGDAAFRTWLYALVLNTVRDQARKRARDVRRDQQADWVNQEEASDDERLEALWQATLNLSPRQRDAVLLVYSEGLDHATTGKILGCGESTIAWHLHAARKRLRALLGLNAA